MTNDLSGKPVQKIKYTELDTSAAPGMKIPGGSIDVIRNVKLRVHVSVGQCEITVRDLLDLRENSVLTLEKSTRDPIDVVVDGQIVATGMLVAVGENFGVRITETYGTRES